MSLMDHSLPNKDPCLLDVGDTSHVVCRYLSKDVSRLYKLSSSLSSFASISSMDIVFTNNYVFLLHYSIN